MDTYWDPDKVDQEEIKESKNQAVTMLPPEVYKEQTVLIEKLIGRESKVELITRADTQQEKKEGKGIS